MELSSEFGPQVSFSSSQLMNPTRTGSEAREEPGEAGGSKVDLQELQLLGEMFDVD